MNKYFFSIYKNHYCDFKGRARRKEYWMFTLWIIIVAIIAAIIDVALGFPEGGPFVLILSLVSILPSLGLTVRRLHDINYSGWWYFINFIPLIGGLILLFLTIKKGDKGPNQYGPDPKADETIPQAE